MHTASLAWLQCSTGETQLFQYFNTIFLEILNAPLRMIFANPVTICGWKYSWEKLLWQKNLSKQVTGHYKLLYLFVVTKFHVFNFPGSWLPTKICSCQIFPNYSTFYLTAFLMMFLKNQHHQRKLLHVLLACLLATSMHISEYLSVV